VFADLATGRLDAAVVDSTLSAYALKDNPALKFELVGDHVPESGADTLRAFAVGKDANPPIFFQQPHFGVVRRP
jgi:ABC-type amino acid transport substrate-binding protein